jgi:hypothetical protein
MVDAFNTAARKRNTDIEARAAETFSLDETFEYILGRDIGLRPNHEFAQDFEAVLLTARMGIAEHRVAINDVLQMHGLLLFL